MRVCFLTSSYPRFPEDSAGVFIHSLACSLVRQGCHVEVIAPRGGTDAAFVTRDGVNIYRFPYFFSRYEKIAYAPGGIPAAIKSHPWLTMMLPFFLLSFFAHALYRSRHVDVLHFHWLQNAVLTLPLKFFSPRPTVVTLWGTDVQWVERSSFMRTLAKRTVSHADAVVSVNDYFKAKLRSYGFSVDNIRVIPNGVDLNRFVSHDRLLLRAKNGLPEKAKLILYVGSLIERKGVKYLIEAMGEVLQQNSNPVLAIIGDGQERAMLEKIACQQGLGSSGVFVGSVPPRDIPEWLRCADLLVLPSLYEGRPNVVLEALAAGLPVVATDIPGTSEIVAHGENGLLVPPRDSRALAKAISELLNDPLRREKMGRAGREMILRLGLTWDDVARRYISLYQELEKAS